MKANYSITNLKSIATNAFFALFMLIPSIVSAKKYNSTLPNIILTGIDLIIQDFTVVESGSISTVTFKIKNIGSQSWRDSIRYQLYVSIDGRDLGTKVDATSGGLNPENSWTITATYKVPNFATKLDKAYFIICVDTSNLIPEINENNNFMSL
jgi:subtilase family serine protease